MTRSMSTSTDRRASTEVHPAGLFRGSAFALEAIRPLRQVPRNHDPLDLRGPVHDLEHLRVIDEPGQAEPPQPSIGPEDLAARDRGAEGRVGPVTLRVGDGDAALGRAPERGSLPREEPPRGEGRRGVREGPLDPLEIEATLSARAPI